MRKVVEFINKEIFNNMLSNPKYCTCGSGIQLKLLLSEIIQWLDEKKYLVGCSKMLEQSLECTSILSFDKSMFLDESIRRDICPSINIQQLRRIFTSFSPDEFIPDKVTEKVLSDITKLARSEKPESEIFLDSQSLLILDFNTLELDSPYTSQIDW